MTDQPPARKLFGRPATVPKVDVKAFLESLVDASPEVQETRKALEDADREITQLKDRLQMLEDDITSRVRNYEADVKRITRQGDIWRDTANELRVQLEVIVTAAVAACDQATSASRSVIEQAKAALAASKEQLARQGMAMTEASTHQKLIKDEDMRKIGEMFGANRRRKEDAIQPQVSEGQVPDKQV
jgi:chromosome segregation ATPase